jgi:hypothetical protein
MSGVVRGDSMSLQVQGLSPTVKNHMSCDNVRVWLLGGVSLDFFIFFSIFRPRRDKDLAASINRFLEATHVASHLKKSDL